MIVHDGDPSWTKKISDDVVQYWEARVNDEIDQVSLPRTLYIRLYPRIFFPCVFGLIIFGCFEAYQQSHDKWYLLFGGLLLYYLLALMRIRLRLTEDELISYPFRFFILSPPNRIEWSKIREIKCKSVDAGGKAKGVMLFVLQFIGLDNEKPVQINTTIFPIEALEILAKMIETKSTQAQISGDVRESMQRWVGRSKRIHSRRG